MTRWALVVRQLQGSGQALHWNADLIGEVVGTREDAMAALWQHAQTYQPRHPVNVGRRVVCRDGDDGFLVINHGMSRDYPCEFRVHEVLWDSGAVAPPLPRS
ncbi:hypothetical protein ACTWP5_18465 [Streptomyces sp. 4N509B]|uniref:hypothetical protein n=1 Tax=Streptomyces sp. 4N509B TaxID=3457413 RepID=UPI003FD23098